MSRVVLGALVLFLPLLAACAVTPADPARAAAIAEFPPPESWPASDPGRAAKVHEEIPECIDTLGAFGQGILYACKSTDAPATSFRGATMIFRSANATGFEDSFATAKVTWDGGEWKVPHASVVMILSLIERADADHVGTCIYLSSLVGVSDQEDEIISEMLFRGWRVIALWPALSTYSARAYMYPESPDDELAVAGLAASTDVYLSSAAYAAEAALAYLQQTDPHLQQRPVVLIGSSLGAISAPTVAARLRSSAKSRLDAAVLIGGGVGLIGISSSSTLMRDQFSLRLLRPVGDGTSSMVPRPTSPEHVSSIIDRAMQRSRLDPHQTAAALRDIPVLLLHATKDEIVPAAAGDALYERLGRPERWTYHTGHVGLFLLLPFEANNIAHWVTQTVRASNR